MPTSRITQVVKSGVRGFAIVLVAVGTLVIDMFILTVVTATIIDMFISGGAK